MVWGEVVCDPAGFTNGEVESDGNKAAYTNKENGMGFRLEQHAEELGEGLFTYLENKDGETDRQNREGHQPMRWSRGTKLLTSSMKYLGYFVPDARIQNAELFHRAILECC